MSNITDVKYSPDGALLAAACHDNNIYLFEAGGAGGGDGQPGGAKGGGGGGAGAYKRLAVCRGHSSFVTHIDFSRDGTVLQSNDAAHEILYWATDTGKQITNAYGLRDKTWETFTCVLGWPVLGIWDGVGENCEINALARSRASGQSTGGSGSGSAVLATAGDHASVRLARYPCLKGAETRVYHAHCTPPTCMRFLADDSKLLTCGGKDACFFQWAHRDARD